MISETAEAAQVTFIVATEDVPLVVDVSIVQRPLDPDDPRRPGDVIFHDARVSVESMIDGLESMVHILRGAK